MLRITLGLCALVLFALSAQTLFFGHLGLAPLSFEVEHPLRMILTISLLAGGVVALYGAYWATEDGV